MVLVAAGIQADRSLRAEQLTQVKTNEAGESHSTPMHHTLTPIRVLAVTEEGHPLGCGACLHSATGPQCQQSVDEPCQAPQLVGSPEELSRLVAALAHDLGWSGGRLDGHLVRALKVAPGEAELTLAVAPVGSGASLAQAAFETLRRLLPDTDITVHHAGAPCHRE